MDIWSPYTSAVGVIDQGSFLCLENNLGLENMEFLLCRSYQPAWKDSASALESAGKFVI